MSEYGIVKGGDILQLGNILLIYPKLSRND